MGSNALARVFTNGRNIIVYYFIFHKRNCWSNLHIPDKLTKAADQRKAWIAALGSVDIPVLQKHLYSRDFMIVYGSCGPSNHTSILAHCFSSAASCTPAFSRDVEEELRFWSSNKRNVSVQMCESNPAKFPITGSNIRARVYSSIVFSRDKRNNLFYIFKTFDKQANPSD